MAEQKEIIKEQIEKLLSDGAKILLAELKQRRNNDTDKSDNTNSENNLDSKSKNNTIEISNRQAYQIWYSQALRTVEQLLPDRYNEFVQYYKQDKRKENEINFLTYTIYDYWLGLQITRGKGIYETEVVQPLATLNIKFRQQIYILSSCLERLDSILSNIQGTLQAELFDDELSAAEELLKKGHLRATGEP